MRSRDRDREEAGCGVGGICLKSNYREANIFLVESQCLKKVFL